MSKRTALVATATAVLALAAGGTYALGGGGGLIWDDGHAVRPGTLDDGKNLLRRTSITTEQAVAAATAAQSGQLGQVDLKERGGEVYYVVDVGDREVSVDAATGGVAGIAPKG